MKKDFVLYKVHYPAGKKDPQELTKEEVQNMLETRSVYGRKILRKIQ